MTRGGRGRLLVLCPRLSTTQADLGELTELLRERGWTGWTKLERVRAA
ncbi:hypothetical protein [Nonomuraea coxensis]|nr:hypothetical protein [Nonomuraea coxensis]